MDNLTVMSIRSELRRPTHNKILCNNKIINMFDWWLKCRIYKLYATVLYDKYDDNSATNVYFSKVCFLISQNIVNCSIMHPDADIIVAQSLWQHYLLYTDCVRCDLDPVIQVLRSEVTSHPCSSIMSWSSAHLTSSCLFLWCSRMSALGWRFSWLSSLSLSFSSFGPSSLLRLARTHDRFLCT